MRTDTTEITRYGARGMVAELSRRIRHLTESERYNLEFASEILNNDGVAGCGHKNADGERHCFYDAIRSGRCNYHLPAEG